MKQIVLLKLKYEYLREEAEFLLNNFMNVNHINQGEVIIENDYFVRLYELLDDDYSVFILPFGLYANTKLNYTEGKTTHFSRDFAYVVPTKSLEVIYDPSQLEEDVYNQEEFTNYLFSSPLSHFKSANEYTYGVMENNDVYVYLKYIMKDPKQAEVNYKLLKDVRDLRKEQKKSLKAHQTGIKFQIKRHVDMMRIKKQRLYFNKAINGKLVLIGKSEFIKQQSKISLNEELYPSTSKIIGQFYFVTFDYKALDDLDGVAYNLVSETDGEVYKLKNRKYNAYYNYNHIRGIHKTEKYVYYTRNTISGNILVQKKVRYYFDKSGFKYRVYIGYLLSKFDRVNFVFFEKNISKLDESAKQVYDNLAVKKKYIALMKDAPDYEQLKAKYQDAVIEPGSIRYYQKVFAAKYAVGTEVTSHLATLRSHNSLLRKHLQKMPLVFLQHGIMMAISLHTSERSFFRRDGYYNIAKFVVSSIAEENHVVEYGYYKRDDVWRTGLAHFDHKVSDQKKDLITIMHTWRPYEESSQNIEQTSYYQDVMDLYQIANAKYPGQVRIIWHPKMSEYMMVDSEESINDILSHTKLLITDYSSVAFDAFNRGANVLFDWRKKEEIMKRLDSSIMYNEEMAFGDVFLDLNNTEELIEKAYVNAQSQENIDKYRFFNEFNDNQNTQRICTKLEELVK